MKIQLSHGCYGEMLILPDGTDEVDALNALLVSFNNELASMSSTDAVIKLINILGEYESTGMCDQCGTYTGITVVELKTN